MTQTSFYLHSTKNRRLYPPAKYPLTHLFDYQSIERRLSKQSTYVQHFKYTFLLLLLFILISTIFFRIHFYIYNSFFGPFHQNLEEFIGHIKNFENGQSWFKRIEYIQIELGENNIQNPLHTYETIRRYSDPITRRNHISTYKKVKKPNIYVKLPTRSQNNFHAHHPFHFSSYSIRTLQCIAKNLQSKSETTYKRWLEKSEYVKYINEEYAKNSTLFNMLVLTKCGILIGYLYRPMYERAFTPSGEHEFTKYDIAFDATRQYCSYYLLVICILFFLCLFLKGLYYLLIYLSNIIRFKFLYKYGLLPLALDLPPDVLEELWLLNIDDSPYKQLLQLDEFIQRSQHKFNNELFIIETNVEQLYIVLLKIKLYKYLHFDNDFSSPFIICPVNDVRKIVQYGGICYGEDSSWIPWPSMFTDEHNYSEWLHEELMEISEHYKNQYEHRIRYEKGNESQHLWNFANLRPNFNNVRQRRKTPETRTADENELEQLIHEEENFQRLKCERQHFYEQYISASTRFIAKFRMEQKLNKKLIDSTMEQENLKCTICYVDFKLNDCYEKWPCPSKIPHIFHYDCMLNTLRRSNTCPICRHPIEAARVTNSGIYQFLANLVF